MHGMCVCVSMILSVLRVLIAAAAAAAHECTSCAGIFPDRPEYHRRWGLDSLVEKNKEDMKEEAELYLSICARCLDL